MGNTASCFAATKNTLVIQHNLMHYDTLMVEGNVTVIIIIKGVNLENFVKNEILHMRMMLECKLKLIGQWRRNHGCAGCWRTPMYVLVAMLKY